MCQPRLMHHSDGLPTTPLTCLHKPIDHLERLRAVWGCLLPLCQQRVASLFSEALQPVQEVFDLPRSSELHHLNLNLHLSLRIKMIIPEDLRGMGMTGVVLMTHFSPSSITFGCKILRHGQGDSGLLAMGI